MTSITGTPPPIHRRFSESEAMIQIRNRYTIIRRKIPNQLEALRQDSQFREFCKGLYARGYKDWMIIATIYNVILNLKFHKQGGDNRNVVEMEGGIRAISEGMIEDVFATDNFVGEMFNICLMTFHSTVLLTWGFHPRLQMIKPEVIENFLRARMRHFDFDLPHNPIFADPPGDWPL